MVIIAFESAQKQRTFRTRECETKVKKRATLDSSLFRHTSSSTTDRLRTCSSSQTPVKTNKKKERRVSVKQTNIGHHRLHEAEEEEALERLSLFFFLSLCWEKIHSPRRQLLTHFVQCTSQRSANWRRITLYNHRQHHLLPSKGRERERDPRSLSRAHNAREQLKRAWERYKTKKPLSSRAVLIRI